jgi:hypothetical protein
MDNSHWSIKIDGEKVGRLMTTSRDTERAFARIAIVSDPYRVRMLRSNSNSASDSVSGPGSAP